MSDSPARLSDQGRVLVFGSFAFALWTVVGRYWGIEHDAQIYLTQALEILNPEVYSDDLFFRFASQDEFTAFPRLLAALITWVGIDEAATLLTFASGLAWVAMAWFVVNRLMLAPLSYLSLALVTLLPITYGAGNIFKLVEPFLSARPLAGALSLGAIALATRDRNLSAFVLLAIAMAFHPLIAFPAALVIAGLWWIPRSNPYLIVCGMAIAALAVVGSIVVPAVPLMDGVWLQMTRFRSDFLFLDEWRAADWEHAVLPIATLAIYVRQCPRDVGAGLVATAITIAVTGLTLAAIATWIAPLTLLLQGQPWRWVWPAAFLAVALLPRLVHVLWAHSPQTRTTCLLLIAAYLLAGWSSASDLPPMGVAGLLVTAALLHHVFATRLSPSAQRLLFVAAWSAAVMSALALVASAAALLKGQFGFGADPPAVETIADLSKLLPVRGVLLLVVWYAAFRLHAVAAAAAGVAVAFLLSLSVPGAWSAWRQSEFVAMNGPGFATWREIIPEQAEIVWPQELRAVWLLLERRSYLSASQLGGVVFSRELANEMRVRMDHLQTIADSHYWRRGEPDPPALSPDAILEVCRRSSAGFVVSESLVGSPVAQADYPAIGRAVYLHDCNMVWPVPRQLSSHATFVTPEFPHTRHNPALIRNRSEDQ